VATWRSWTAQVHGRLLLGHTAALADPAAPVLVTAVIEPGGAGTLDATCSGCSPAGQLGQLGPDTMLVLEHQHSCPWFAGLAARALP